MFQRIKQLRETLALKKGEFAAAIGMDNSQYGKVEKGIMSISVANCMEMASKFSVSLDWLLMGKGDMFLPERLTNSPSEKENDGTIGTALKDQITLLTEDRNEWIITKRHMEQLVSKLNDEIDELKSKLKTQMKADLTTARKK